MVLVNFWRYPDPYQRFLIRIRIRIQPNDTDPTGSGSGSETLEMIIKIKSSKFFLKDQFKTKNPTKEDCQLDVLVDIWGSLSSFIFCILNDIFNIAINCVFLNNFKEIILGKNMFCPLFSHFSQFLNAISTKKSDSKTINQFRSFENLLISH